MKQLICFFYIAALVIAADINAQEKGNILLSGSFKFTVSETIPDELSLFGGRGYKNTQFTILPRAGLFINDNTVIGLGLGYSQNKTELKLGSEKETLTSPQLFIEPFIRNYKKLGDKASFFVDASVLYRSGTDKLKYTDSYYPEDNETYEFENSSFGLSVIPGFTYKFTDRIAIELSIGKLSYSKFESKLKGAPSSSAVKNSDYGLDLDLKHVMLGVEFYLSR